MTLPGVPGEYEIELKTTEGRAETEPKMMAQGRWVTPEYFTVMHIPILTGELCRDEPNVPTAMVNHSFANLYLNGSAAIGRHLVQPGKSRSAAGRDPRHRGRRPGDRTGPRTASHRLCVLWRDAAGLLFVIRAHGEPGSLVATIRRKMLELEPLRSVYESRTPLADHISDAYAENRLRMILLAFFALTAIALASVGLYGTLSYVVNVRRAKWPYAWRWAR